VSAPPPTAPRLRFHERLDAGHVALVLLVLAAAFSLPVLRGSGRRLDYLANLKRFAGRFLPPDLSVLPQTLRGLGETFQIAVLATLFAVVLSLPLALAGARTVAPRPLVAAARMVMNAIRTLPSLIWALVAVAVVGANPLAGVVALTFYSMGYLGKFFSDGFESVDLKVAAGLGALGADRVQAFQYGLWPQARPLVWSQSLWMLEYNLRSAAIVGYVGAGGIGVQLHEYQEYYQWDRFATVLLCILVLVTVLDFVGERLRARLTRRAAAAALAA
jgi:phosphonate transport system permease protein